MVHELVGIHNGRVTIDSESRTDLKVGEQTKELIQRLDLINFLSPSA